MKRGSTLWAVLALLLLTLACGGGSSSSEGGDDSFSGNPGINPEPEDVFDLPNTLPDSFRLAGCGPDNAIFDLDLRIFAADRNNDGQPDAKLHDYDGDGDMDSILLVQNDPDPKTLIFEGSSHTDTPMPPDMVEFPMGGGSSGVIGGYEFDSHLGCQANGSGDLEISLAIDLIAGAWQFAPYADPIFEEWLIPAPFPPPPGSIPPYGLPLGCAGYEGPADTCPSSPAPGGLSQKPGIHVVATRILELPDIIHCANQVWRILICPVDCHCEADGTPIPFNRRCIRERVPNDSPCN